MRKYDIPYVKQNTVDHNIPPPNPTTDVLDMELEEIRAKEYFCYKAKYDVTKCLDCEAPCFAGKRVMELLERETTPVPPKPAKEEPKKRKTSLFNKRQQLEGLGRYIEALNSGDPVKYIMDVNGVSRSVAYSRIYTWKNKWETENVRLLAKKYEDLKAVLESENKVAAMPVKSDPETVKKPAEKEEPGTLITTEPGTSVLPKNKSEKLLPKVEGLAEETSVNIVSMAMEEKYKGLEKAKKELDEKIAALLLKVTELRQEKEKIDADLSALDVVMNMFS